MNSQIALQEVDSSQIHSIGHDPVTNTLAIRFKSRGEPTSLYHYSNFSAEDFAAFRDAESIGKHFGQHIKSATDKYPFVRVDGAPAAKPNAQALTLDAFAMQKLAAYSDAIVAREVLGVQIDAGAPVDSVAYETACKAAVDAADVLAYSVLLIARDLGLAPQRVKA